MKSKRVSKRRLLVLCARAPGTRAAAGRAQVEDGRLAAIAQIYSEMSGQELAGQDRVKREISAALTWLIQQTRTK